MFLCIPEQFLKEAEEKLEFAKLDYKKTQEALKLHCDLSTLNDAKLTVLLKDLELPYSEVTLPFYNKLRDAESQISFRLLALAFVLCSEWEDPSKSKLLFELYADKGLNLTLDNGVEMIAEIYFLAIEALPSLQQIPLVKDYLQTIVDYKQEVKEGMLTTLFSNEEGEVSELSIEEFQLKFQEFKVKFLTSDDARTAFKRIATVKHVLALRSSASKIQDIDPDDISELGDPAEPLFASDMV